MRLLSVITILGVAFLTGCQATDAPTRNAGGVMPNGYSVSRFSAQPPEIANGEIAFTLFPGDCSSRNYGDGRGENDCRNMNSKSQIGGCCGEMGQTMVYAFDVWIDPKLRHRGHHQPEAASMTGQGVNNSRVEIARWQGSNLIKNHIYDVEVDRTRGITFLGRRCAGPERFGSWVRFEMRVKWANDENGWIEVNCDGAPVYRAQGLATNQAPHCHVANHCEPGVYKNPRRINNQFGLMYDAEWIDGRRTMPRIHPDGLTFRFRDFDIRRI